MATKQTEADRRSHPRLRFELPIDVHSEHRLLEAHTADISEGGVFIRTKAQIRRGATISLHLKLDGQTILVIGEVRWAAHDPDGSRRGIGVAFKDMSPHARAVLKNYMRVHIGTLHGGLAAVKAPPRPRAKRPERKETTSIIPAG